MARMGARRVVNPSCALYLGKETVRRPKSETLKGANSAYLSDGGAWGTRDPTFSATEPRMALTVTSDGT
jgi:hypothetical protein